MLKVQLVLELRQLIRSERVKMEKVRKQANKSVGYVKPKPKCEQLYIEGWLDNGRYANILGLEIFIYKHPELTYEQITKMIKFSPVSLLFLNYVLKLMPNAVEIIAYEGAFNFGLMYARKCDMIKNDKQNVIR